MFNYQEVPYANPNDGHDVHGGRSEPECDRMTYATLRLRGLTS